MSVKGCVNTCRAMMDSDGKPAYGRKILLRGCPSEVLVLRRGLRQQSDAAQPRDRALALDDAQHQRQPREPEAMRPALNSAGVEAIRIFKRNGSALLLGDPFGELRKLHEVIAVNFPGPLFGNFLSKLCNDVKSSFWPVEQSSEIRVVAGPIRAKPKTQAEQSIAVTQTPNEIIEAAHKSLRAALRSEVLDVIRKMDPYRFEQVVVDVLVAMGYGGSREEAAHVTQKQRMRAWK